MTATATVCKSVRLEAPSASGKKFYTIEIANPAADSYFVNFTFGAVGGSVKTGTKTPVPVSLEKAETIFAKLQKEKETGESHYQPVNSAVTTDGRVADPIRAGFQIINGHRDTELPKCIPPRLLNDIDESMVMLHVHLPTWWVQFKHDGDRVQLHSNKGVVTLFSARSAKTRACPLIIAEACERMPLDSFALDGEIVDDTLWVFDLLSTEDTDWRALPYESRMAALESLIPRLHCPTIKLVETARSEMNKTEMILSAKETHQEGVVFANKNAAYRSGRPSRGGDSLRWKFVASGSFIVSKHNIGEGKMSINVALHDGTEIGTCSVIGKEPASTRRKEQSKWNHSTITGTCRFLRAVLPAITTIPPNVPRWPALSRTPREKLTT